MHKLLQLHTTKGVRHHVTHHVLRATIPQAYHSILCSLTGEVLANVDVLGATDHGQVV